MVSSKALPLLLFVAPSSALEVLNGLQVSLPALDCSMRRLTPSCALTDPAEDH